MVRVLKMILPANQNLIYMKLNFHKNLIFNNLYLLSICSVEGLSFYLEANQFHFESKEISKISLGFLIMLKNELISNFGILIISGL